MHGCLRLTEILEVIFHLVFNSPRSFDSCLSFILYLLPTLIPAQYAQDRRSILNLALTCRTFRDPALKVLYAHLANIWPLIMCLPPVQSASPVHDVPTQQFHPLIVLRAARVRVLHNIPGRKNTAPSDAAFAFLVANTPRDAPLFPKLHSLTWFDSRLTSIPALCLFLPAVETLSFIIRDTRFRKVIIPGLRTAAPCLKALGLDGIAPGDDLLDIESSLINYPEGLTGLSIRSCDISNSLLNVISAWPHLRWLTFHLGSKSIITTPLHVHQPFQALTRLHIECVDLILFTSFLRAVQIVSTNSDVCPFAGCPNLRTIHIAACGCSPANIWSELLRILTYTKLERLILNEMNHAEKQSCHTSSSFDIGPLLARPTALADLNTLIISPAHTTTIALTDADIVALARACPHLDILGLEAHNTPVSMYALRTLVGRCSDLRELSLCVDAELDALGAIPPNNDDDEIDLQPNMRLDKLYIGDSPISYAGPLHPPTAPDLMRSIPRFLHMIAPRVERIMRLTDGSWSNGMYRRRWKVVSSALSVMVRDEVKDGD